MLVTNAIDSARTGIRRTGSLLSESSGAQKLSADANPTVVSVSTATRMVGQYPTRAWRQFDASIPVERLYRAS